MITKEKEEDVKKKITYPSWQLKRVTLETKYLLRWQTVEIARKRPDDK